MKWSLVLFPTTPRAKILYYFVIIVGAVAVILNFVHIEDATRLVFAVLLIIYGLIGMDKLQRKKKQQEPENS